jgi:protein-S-isoprenylcysteine O-methyltransferase Ste14
MSVAGPKRSVKDMLFVSIQAILFCLYLFHFPLFNFTVPRFMQYIGLFIACLGMAAIISAMLTLKRNLTAFPSPKQNARLVTKGLYKYIRHPIYTGILMFTLGYGLYSENTLRLLICAVLFLLFFLKAKYEEGLLITKFPEYEGYKTKSKMFFPGIF